MSVNFVACTDDLRGDPDGDTGTYTEPSGLAVLGYDSHDPDAVSVTVVATEDLDVPRDLEFNPEVEGQLWVVNRGSDSVTVFDGVGTGEVTGKNYFAYWNQHFLAQPSSLAMADDGTFATVHETDDLTQGDQTPADFMGPSLWTADTEVFMGGHEDHLDMLHNSPNGMGIAWEVDRAFWVYDGYHASLTRYDFKDDHGPGGTDHSDGVIVRHVEGQMMWLEDVPSHMVYDHDNELLYVNDTGNNRVVAVDPSVGAVGGFIGPNYDQCTMYAWEGAELTTLVDGYDHDSMLEPSGMALHEGILYVTDHQSATIFAFDLAGELIDYLPLDAGALMGIEVDERDGSLYVVDPLDERILRVAALE